MPVDLESLAKSRPVRRTKIVRPYPWRISRDEGEAAFRCGVREATRE